MPLLYLLNKFAMHSVRGGAGAVDGEMWPESVKLWLNIFDFVSPVKFNPLRRQTRQNDLLH